VEITLVNLNVNRKKLGWVLSLRISPSEKRDEQGYWTRGNLCVSVAADHDLRSNFSVTEKSVSLLSIAASFLRLGATTYGGLFGGMARLEREIVHRRRWMTTEEMSLAMIVATFVPAPRFLSWSAVIGYQFCGWPGAVVASVSLVGPACLLILGGVIGLSPELLSGPLAPLRRAVAVAVVGIIFGTAYRLFKLARKNGGFITLYGRSVPLGHILALAIVISLLLGAPIIPVVLIAAAASYVIGGISSDARN
jgi:chromate transporter